MYDLYDILYDLNMRFNDFQTMCILCGTDYNIQDKNNIFEIYKYHEEYKKLDFSNVTAAFFGCGDQVGYSENFLDAIGLLAKPFMENGGKLIGRWPTEGYEFDLSLALDGDEFLGLGLDNDNEEELTEERLIIWAELIRDEFEA